MSGPWPHKKESVLLVYLARWQGVQVQTVRGQIVSQRDLRLTQCKKEMNSRIHVKVSLKKKRDGKVNRSQVVVARLYRSFCSAKAKCLLAHAHMQVREGDKLKVIRFPWSSTVVTTPTSTSVTSADVKHGILWIHSASPFTFVARKRQEVRSEQQTLQETGSANRRLASNAVFWIGIASPIIFSWSVKAT